MNASTATVSYIGRARFDAPAESHATLDLRRDDAAGAGVRTNPGSPLEFTPADTALVDQIEAALCRRRYDRDQRRRAASDAADAVPPGDTPR